MNTDLISRADAEALFRNARGELHKSAIRNEQNGHPIKDLHTRDLMLLNAEQMIHLLPSVTPKQSGWHYTDLPPSDDPYKRYLVVYSPYDRNYGRNTAPRFEIADYYKGDGLYNDKPWHLTISHSVMEKEILAWKDIGIVDEVMQGAKMVEPRESEEQA